VATKQERHPGHNQKDANEDRNEFQESDYNCDDESGKYGEDSDSYQDREYSYYLPLVHASASAQ